MQHLIEFYSIRGVLGSTVLLTFNIGMLLAFILGNYCNFFVIPKVGAVLAGLCGILLPFFPESPIFLIRQNKIAVSFYKLMKKKIHFFYINKMKRENDFKGSRKVDPILSQHK